MINCFESVTDIKIIISEKHVIGLQVILQVF